MSTTGGGIFFQPLKSMPFLLSPWCELEHLASCGYQQRWPQMCHVPVGHWINLQETEERSAPGWTASPRTPELVNELGKRDP